MKSLLFIATVTALVALLAGVAFAGPEMSIPDSSFNFGYVPQNAKVSHIFWLYSTGDDTLKIEKVVPG